MPRSDEKVYADLMAKLSAAADDPTNRAVATLDGLEAFVLRQIVQQRDYLRDEQQPGLVAALDRRDRDNDALRDALLRLRAAQGVGTVAPGPQEE